MGKISNNLASKSFNIPRERVGVGSRGEGEEGGGGGVGAQTFMLGLLKS